MIQHLTDTAMREYGHNCPILMVANQLGRNIVGEASQPPKLKQQKQTQI